MGNAQNTKPSNKLSLTSPALPRGSEVAKLPFGGKSSPPPCVPQASHKRLFLLHFCRFAGIVVPYLFHSFRLLPH